MNLVTGATGLLGSHIAEKLREQGQPVRCLVRRGSDRTFLESIGCEFVEGDLSDTAAMEQACTGVEIVYHSAAKVGDWGPWEDFQEVTVNGTRRMLDAAIACGVKRFLHISSISVFGYYTEPITLTEEDPTGYGLYKWAYYSRSKHVVEEMVKQHHASGKIACTIIRPAWIYGPRDRATIARLYRMISTGRAKILGAGDNRLNVVYAGNVAEAAIKAANLPEASGEVFNCSNDGDITQQEYFDLWADAIGAPRVKTKVPYAIAYRVGHFLEIVFRLLGKKNPPLITRYAVWLMGRRSFFSAEKARRMLDWMPTVTFDEGVPMTVKGYREQLAVDERAAASPPAAAGATT